MIPPIKRGTARRLGIRQPADPLPWMVAMQDRVNLLAWQMDVIAASYGRPVWRFSAATLAAKREAAE